MFTQQSCLSLLFLYVYEHLSDDTTCVFWLKGFDAHDICQCSCGAPSLHGISDESALPEQLHGKITEAMFRDSIRRLNEITGRYWPPGRMRAPVYAVFPFWFLFILSSSTNNSVSQQLKHWHSYCFVRETLCEQHFVPSGSTDWRFEL